MCTLNICAANLIELKIKPSQYTALLARCDNSFLLASVIFLPILASNSFCLFSSDNLRPLFLLPHFIFVSVVCVFPLNGDGILNCFRVSLILRFVSSERGVPVVGDGKLNCFRVSLILRFVSSERGLPRLDRAIFSYVLLIA